MHKYCLYSKDEILTVRCSLLYCVECESQQHPFMLLDMGVSYHTSRWWLILPSTLFNNLNIKAFNKITPNPTLILHLPSSPLCHSLHPQHHHHQSHRWMRLLITLLQSILSMHPLVRFHYHLTSQFHLLPSLQFYILLLLLLNLHRLLLHHR